MIDQASTPDPFNGADYYECSVSEHLSHETPEEALEYYVDSWCSPDSDVSAVIREIGDITVTAYRRLEVTDRERADWAERAIELVCEQWSEEHGTPDGDDGPSAEALTKARPLMLAAVDALLSGLSVWQCEADATRVYTPEEVERLMRERCSEWFEVANG